MIKWIVTDLDGTLLDHNPSDYVVKVDPDTIKTWNKKVESNKYKFSIATGRHYINVLDLIKQFDIKLPKDGFIIGMNGAQVYCFQKKQLIANTLVPVSEINQFNDLVKYLDKIIANKYMLMGYQNTSEPIFFYNHKTTNFTKWMNEMCVYEHSTDEFANKLIENFNELEHIYKVIIVLKTEFNYDKEISQLEKILPNMCFARSADNFIEIFPKSVSKRIALELINNKYYNIDPKYILAFGDSFNDVPMLEWAGTSVTRITANPKIRDLCEYVIDAPISSFVGDGLDLILLN